VRIEAAGDVTHHGTITANGDSRPWGSSGGGAGGGIYIQCGTLAGSGTLVADGGDTPGSGGDGSGGRVSIDVTTDLLTGEMPGTYVAYAGAGNGSVSVAPGTGGVYEPYATNGTFYLAKAQGALIIIR
jgi:hypothetical protein